MSDRIIAQCILCNHKQELTVKPEDPRFVKCSECGGHTTQYVSRMLSPEELAKYGPVSSSPKKRTVFSIPNQKSKEKDPMSKYPNVTKEFLEAEFAAGKSGIQVEREQGMPSGVISYYMKKFGVKSQFKPVAKKKKVAPTKPVRTLPLIDHDPVNNPKHYTDGGMEVIDILKAKLEPDMFQGFLLGNVIKYSMRYRHKNGMEDLKKAQWYLNRLIGEQSSEALK